MKQTAVLRPKTYSYLTEHNKEDKEEKDTEKWVMKRKVKFEDYKIVYKRLNLKVKYTN